MASGEIVQPTAPTRARRIKWAIWLGLLLAGFGLVFLWDWNWFRPMVESRLSAAVGRRVTVGHFDLQLGRTATALLDDVQIANPDGFGDTPYLAHVAHLAVSADVLAFVRSRRIVLPRIEVDGPDVNAVRLADGRTNFALDTGNSSGSDPALDIGEVAINDGHAHYIDPGLKSDFKLTLATSRNGAPGQGGQQTSGEDKIVVAADGTYAGQPITGHAVGDALLSLRDSSHPYALEAHLQNGPVHLDVAGTVTDPLRLKGTDVKLHVAGPDISLLGPLAGFPMPATPNFDVAGQIDYAGRKITVRDLRGKVGASDVSGTVTVDPTGQRPVVDMNLTSRHVDLADLGGLIGSEPGRTTTQGQTAEQKQLVARAEADPRVLPTRKLSVPQFKAADFHVRYNGDSIVGGGVPFDSLSAVVDLEQGILRIHPATLQVGRGTIAGDITLAPAANDAFELTSDVTLTRVDVGRMLHATGLVNGAGLLGGRVEVSSTGDSVASLIAHGSGSVRLMLAGGNLSAILVDLSGLQFGNALLSALGMPNRAQIECFVADLALQRGVLATRTFLVVTSEADITVEGNLDLAREALDYRLRTESRHLSVGSLPADIGIRGTLKSPRIMPNVGELSARAGAAAGLGVLLTPLGSLLATVQFGTGDKNADACAAVIKANGKRPTASSASTPPASRKTPEHAPAR